MKKILLGVLSVVLVVGFSGCSDKFYGKVKTVYKAGEKIVEVTGIKSTKLKAGAKVAEKYDHIRSKVRGQ